MSQRVDWSEREDRLRSPRVWREVGAGVALVMLEHLLVGGLLGGGGYLLDATQGGGIDQYLVAFFVWGFGIGATQLGYVLPTFAVCFFWRRNVAAGVALGALITFLLNGACFGVLCAGMGR